MDIFLETLNKASLDRESEMVRPIVQLIEMRNDYVHPRIELRPLEVRESELQIGECGRYDPLGIPLSPQNWTPADAEAVLRFVIGFIDHFLVDRCELPPRTVAGLLFDLVDYGDKKCPITGRLNDSWYLLKSRWAIEMRCLKGIFSRNKRVILGEILSP